MWIYVKKDCKTDDLLACFAVFLYFICTFVKINLLYV